MGFLEVIADAKVRPGQLEGVRPKLPRSFG